MSDDESTRPISVAELLARNGSIGSPPVGGHRRRRRGNGNAVSVAELTGEIPIIRTGDIPVVEAPEAPPVDGTVAEVEEADAEVEEPAAEPIAEVEEPVAEVDPAPSAEDEPEPAEDEPEADPAAQSDAEQAQSDAEQTQSDAEQMAPDPVDSSEILLKIADETAVPAGDQDEDDVDPEPQSYLRSSGDTLFSGGTVRDDMARRGVSDPEEDSGAAAATKATPRELRPGKLAAVGRALLAVLQSILAVAFGAGLFIAFDQLWRWNNIVALVLSVLVILGLVVAVRVVRKTEDIVSTLIAVAVGALVTLGPLALLQST